MPKRSSQEVARRLFAARRQAGITQVELAKRLGKSQTLVSQAENALAQVGIRYIAAVLQACGVTDSGDSSAADEEGARDLRLEEIAGMDPETMELVRIGSPRDQELSVKYFWWNNRL